MAAAQGAISKRRKFVADGVFYAELNEFFQRELAEEGYSGVEVRVTPTVTDISTSSTPLHVANSSTWLRNPHCGVPLTIISTSHPRNPHPRSPRRARSTNPRTHLPDPKALQVPRKQCLTVRRQGTEPWSLRCRSVRISTLQIAQWSGRTTCLLWCSQVHHGEWSEGL